VGATVTRLLMQGHVTIVNFIRCASSVRREDSRRKASLTFRRACSSLPVDARSASPRRLRSQHRAAWLGDMQDVLIAAVDAWREKE
jgi:hypothetical protein